MIRNVMKTLGSLRTALVAGVALPLLIVVSASAQTPNPAASPGTGLPEAGPGPAAPPAPQSAGEASTERVVVTGSYIPTAEEVTASPLDTLTTQEVNRSGAQSDVLTVLRQRNPDFVGGGNIGSTNANISSGSTAGGSIISLRGLPTLVLFEGRRIAPSAAIAQGSFNFTDVSLFPVGLISRIEILKDGASATYGSEAVGGVVNIFLKQDFTGVEIGARYGFTVESGVAERRGYLIAGVGNDTTHVTAAVEYYEIDPLFERERGYSRQPFQGATVNYGGVTADFNSFYLLNGVDPRVPRGTAGLPSPFSDPKVQPHSIPAGGTVEPNDPDDPSAGNFFFPSAGFDNPEFTGVYNPVGVSTITTFDLTQAPTNTLDISRTTSYASFTHQVFGKQLELFGDFLFTHQHNESFLNAQPVSTPGGVLILGSVRTNPNFDPNQPEEHTPGDPTSNTYYINEDRGDPAPFNPFEESLDQFSHLFAANRFLDRPRIFTNDSSFYRILGGLRSQITENWNFEAATYYSHFNLDALTRNLVSADALNALIGAQDDDGNPIQGQTLDFFNRFPIGTGPGQVTPENFNTIFGNNIRQLTSFQEVFDGRITGFPFKLPGGAVGVSVGAEYRIEGFKIVDSPEIFLSATPVAEINANRAITSVYAEASIPIVGSQMHVPLIYSLELTLAGRYDHYEGVDEDAKVPKITLRYQPIKDLTLRATYSNSFVAPTLYELYGPNAEGFADAVDLGFGQESQAQVRTGSNPGLNPSTAESYTAGLVYSPSFVPGLTVSADYFRTLQQSIVSGLGGATILGSVEAGGTSSPYADLVGFNNFPGEEGSQPVTGPGQIHGRNDVYYLDTLQNIGAVRVEGFDLNARYNIDLHTAGQLELGINSVVFTLNDVKRTPQSHYYNISGLVGTELVTAGNPDYKLTFLAEYRWQGATLSFNANYIPELKNVVGLDPEALTEDDVNDLETVRDYFTVDGRISYTFKGKTTAGAMAETKDAKSMVDGKGGAGAMAAAGAETMSPVQKLLDGLTTTVGCNNIFDEEPAFVRGANSATNLALYDPYGRFVYFEITKKF